MWDFSTTYTKATLLQDYSTAKYKIQSLDKSKTKTLPTWEAVKKIYEKASLIFAVLAEKEYVNENYGVSLKYMLEVLYCQKILEIFCDVKKNKSINYLLHHIEKHKKDYHTKNEMKEKIVEELFSMEDLNISKY